MWKWSPALIPSQLWKRSKLNNVWRSLRCPAAFLLTGWSSAQRGATTQHLAVATCSPRGSIVTLKKSHKPRSLHTSHKAAAAAAAAWQRMCMWWSSCPRVCMCMWWSSPWSSGTGSSCSRWSKRDTWVNNSADYFMEKAIILQLDLLYVFCNNK